MVKAITDEDLIPVARELQEDLTKVPQQDGVARARALLLERGLVRSEQEAWNFSGRVCELARMLRESEEQLDEPLFTQALRSYRDRNRRPRR